MVGFFKRWIREEDGLAAVEFAMIFPMMLTMLLGVFDMGYGILAAQKTIRASQVTADLIARHNAVSEGEIMEAVEAGELALLPFGAGNFEYRITSLEFTDDTGNYDVLWSRSSGGASFGNFSVEGLGVEGSGLVVVQVNYQYEPAFSNFMFGTMTFSEIAFVRGRASETIPLG